MKKFIASISLLCYFVVTTGVVINSHYCMKRLVSTHLFEAKVKVCGNCGMETHDSNGCCRDEIKVVKLVQDQSNNLLVSFQFLSLEPIQSIPSDFIVSSFFNIDVIRHFHNHSPPLLSAQDTYLQNGVFRI